MRDFFGDPSSREYFTEYLLEESKYNKDATEYCIEYCYCFSDKEQCLWAELKVWKSVCMPFKDEIQAKDMAGAQPKGWMTPMHLKIYFDLYYYEGQQTGQCRSWAATLSIRVEVTFSEDCHTCTREAHTLSNRGKPRCLWQLWKLHLPVIHWTKLNCI